jgi:2-amino-4-hydroxy-6-hydroxymethyldihydropteridine diphosphokinase
MAEVFIGLGSNLDGPAENLREAIRRLARRIVVERVSSVYETDPVGLREQPRFLNAVLGGSTELTPRALLDVLRGIEDDMGRTREVQFGPRTIDLDLLLYGDLRVSGPEVSVPHPRMADRRFVLVPLAEIAPGVRLERAGATVVELLASLPSTDRVDRVELPGWPPLR